MIPLAIRTIRQLIIWEYAGILPAFQSGQRNDWLQSVRNYDQLSSNDEKWRHILYEAVKIDPNRCAYCGSEEELSVTYIVPRQVCSAAEAHNIVRVCRKCNISKGAQDLIKWWGAGKRNKLPAAVLGKYLKILYLCHECNGTLDDYALNEEGRVDILYPGYLFAGPCSEEKERIT